MTAVGGMSSPVVTTIICILIDGSCLTYFINPQQYLPTTQKNREKESIAVMPGLVRICNRVLWVSR